MRLPTVSLLLAASWLPANAQLTYQLDSTLLAIDLVVDSDRVNMPWEILWGPDDRLWMTDGPLITRWDPVTDVIDTLVDRGEGNGLGMVLHPDFPATPELFAVFDTADYYGYGSFAEVKRFTYDAVNDTLIDEVTLLGYPHSGEHAGGRLLFDTTGHILLTTADYWVDDTALFSMKGRTLRFATDGSVPPDNPRADYQWTFGHRNPQGLAMLPNGAVVNSEHGQLLSGNEINLLLPGRNYGWPVFDANGCLGTLPDSCTSPTYTYEHPLVNFAAPPSGVEFYTSDAIPEFQNALITCILWYTGLEIFTLNPALDSVVAQDYLTNGAFDDMVRNRDIAILPDGSFYLITNDRQNARIRWVHPEISTSSTPPVVHEDDLRIYPNPVEDRLTVVLPTGNTNAQLVLLDSQGRKVSVQAHRVGDRFLIGMSGLPGGLYTVRVQRGGERWTERLVKR